LPYNKLTALKPNTKRRIPKGVDDEENLFEAENGILAGVAVSSGGRTACGSGAERKNAGR
jgi:hypothetical protein